MPGRRCFRSDSFRLIGIESQTIAFKLSAGLLPARWNGGLSLPAPRLGPFLFSYRQKEDAMVRDPWIVAAAVFAFGVIGWVVVAERPPNSQFRIEAARTFGCRP